MALTFFDWLIIIVYLAAMVGLSFRLARDQKDARDYYLGGNKTAPLPIALSRRRRGSVAAVRTGRAFCHDYPDGSDLSHFSEAKSDFSLFIS